MELKIKRAALSNEFLETIIASQANWSWLNGHQFEDGFKLQRSEKYVLSFKSFQMFDLFTPVHFVFDIVEASEQIAITGQIRISPFVYLSVVFAAVVFGLMMLWDGGGMMPLIMLLLTAVSSVLNIRQLKRKMGSKVELFFSWLEVNENSKTG